MLAIAGFCYFANSSVTLMPKGFGDLLFPYILLPPFIAEASLAVWLLEMGVDNERWCSVAVARASV